MSMILVGELRGIRVQKRGDYTFRYAVVEGADLQSHEVQLSQALEKPDTLAQLEKLKGKLLAVPFYIRRFASKTGSSFSLNYDGDRLPTEYKGA